jgi:putative MATE family efflux protein
MEQQTAPVANGATSRRVFNLAWPVIGENFLETLLGIVDTWLVAALGAVALAGVGAAVQIMFFVIAAMSAVSVGNAVLVAQAVGARNFGRAGDLAKQSLVWSVLLSFPLILVGLFFSDQLVLVFGMEPAVNAIAADYLRVTMGTVFVLTMLFIGSGVLRGAGDARTPMVVTAVANVINVVLAYGLIYGHLGLPALGAVGSAWGTFIARGIALVLLIAALWQGRNGVSIRAPGNWWPDWQVARQILNIGVPAAVEQTLNTVAFLLLTTVVAHLGTATLAAQRVAINAMSLSFLPGFGFGLAATTLVGQSIGARRPLEGQAAARIATIWAVIWMGLLGVVFFFFAEAIMGLFTQDPEVVRIGAGGLRVLAAVQPFWAVNFVQSGALRGTGNTRFPLWVGTTSMWVAVGLGALFVNTIAGSLTAVWAAFLLTMPVAAAIFWWQFQRTIHERAGGVRPEIGERVGQ